jgi:hypothetical protein
MVRKGSERAKKPGAVQGGTEPVPAAASPRHHFHNGLAMFGFIGPAIFPPGGRKLP